MQDLVIQEHWFSGSVVEIGFCIRLCVHLSIVDFSDSSRDIIKLLLNEIGIRNFACDSDNFLRLEDIVVETREFLQGVY